MPFRDPLVEDEDIVSVGLDKLIPGNLRIGQYIESASYVGGDSGWRIDANGSAEFNNVTVRGDLINHHLSIMDGVGINISELTSTGALSHIRWLNDLGEVTADITKSYREALKFDFPAESAGNSKGMWINHDLYLTWGSDPVFYKHAIDAGFAYQNAQLYGGENFHWAFDNVIWWNKQNIGTGTKTYVQSPSAKHGGHYGHFNGYDWYISKYFIPYDPSAVYRSKIRVWQEKQPVDTTKNKFYAGFAGFAYDGSTYVNRDGINSISNQHYWTAENQNLSTNSWVEFSGEWSGHAAPGASAIKGEAHADVRYMVPMFIVNYNGGEGICNIDSFTIYKERI